MFIFVVETFEMGKIILEDIEIYAHHGHLKEEQTIGARFRVNLDIEISNEKACISDRLEDTLDYQKAYDIVCNEMKETSALLEHIALRISRGILNASSLIKLVKVKVSKLNPPLGGNVKAVSVEFINERDK